MYRDDSFTVYRPIEIKEQNEITGYENQIIAEAQPCHLSIKSLAALNQSQSMATINYSYTLFYDTNLGIILEGNDIIEVTTGQGQFYQLRAGQSKIFNLTVQTICEVFDIV